MLSDTDKPKQHLDAFLSKNTSEDNDSFNIILAETAKKQREKHAWLYENEENRKKVFLLPLYFFTKQQNLRLLKIESIYFAGGTCA